MTERICITEECTRPAEPQRLRCSACKHQHKQRNRRIDPVDIEIAVYGRRPVPGMSYAERRRVTYLLTLEGLSARKIAAIVVVNPRSVTRYRKADRLGWKGTTG